MPANLYLAPVGADKTAIVVDGILAAIRARRRAMPKVWALTANRRQEMRFRERLTGQGDAESTIFNIEYFNFYTLYDRILKLAAVPARKINGHTQLALLRSLADRLSARGELRYFGRIASTRGFIEIVADLINELKQNGVDAQRFAQAAGSDKDRDIAAIYRLYQQTLIDSNLVDVEGEGWLALKTLPQRRDIVADVDLIVVDGFDQYTPMQARLLAELALAAPRVDITLTAIPEHVSLLSPRSKLTRSRLEDAHKKVGPSLQIKTPPTSAGGRHADLAQLGEVIFQAKPAASAGKAIRLIAMPGVAEESKAILRAVKEQLLNGALADDILIALRDWDLYASYFRRGQDEYDLPLLLHNPPLLHTIPVIAVLIDLLDLAPHYRRAELLDVLRSPYIDSGLSEEDIDLLDKWSRERLFLRGAKDKWFEMVAMAAAHPGEDDDESTVAVSQEDADSLARKLDRFLLGVKPPASAKADDYIAWLENLIGREFDPEDHPADSGDGFTLRMRQRALDSTVEKPVSQRDSSALDGLATVLRDLRDSCHILHSNLGEPSQIKWTRFWSELKYALQNTSGQYADTARDGRVLVSTASDARGLPHKHVYIMGLAEGLFPANTQEDPIFLDSEREQLQSKGIDLATQAERVDDRGLFLELISLPRESLTLSRPTLKDGNFWLESYLWAAVVQAFPSLPIETAAVGSVAPPEKAASDAELMLAMAHRLAPYGADEGDNARAWQTWLDSNPAQARLWSHIRRGQRVEKGRLSSAPFDGYSGQITRAPLLAQAANRLGASRVWSASQLKDYGLCGFRFFAKRLLKLAEDEEPEAGYDTLQLGLLNHKILEDSYRRFSELGLAIHADNLDRALEIFERIALERLASAPRDFGFLPRASWQAEKMMLFRRLQALIKLDFSADSPLQLTAGERQVYAVEHNFENIAIDLPELGERLRLRGLIDRIDVLDGNLVLVDYKTGTRGIGKGEMEAGRDFQIMAYVSALEAQMGNGVDAPTVKHAKFWHLRNLATSGDIDLDDGEDQAAIASARAHVAKNLRDGRAGSFPAQPTQFDSGKCIRYCEYARLCRVSVTSRYKSSRSDGS